MWVTTYGPFNPIDRAIKYTILKEINGIKLDPNNKKESFYTNYAENYHKKFSEVFNCFKDPESKPIDEQKFSNLPNTKV